MRQPGVHGRSTVTPNVSPLVSNESQPSDVDISETFMPLPRNPPGRKKSLWINIGWVLKFYILNSIQKNTEHLESHERTQLVILVLKEE